MHGNCSNENDLPSHGAILRAIIAASIGILPEPQHGSRKESFRCHHDICMSAAAMFSFIGASPACVLYHLLCIHFQVVFRYILSLF